MSMASVRAVTRLLTAAFLLLLGSATNGRAHIPAHRHHSSHPGVAAANHGALLAATPQWKRVDTAQPQVLTSEASQDHRPAPSASPPTRDFVSLRSCECATSQAARPPPFHA